MDFSAQGDTLRCNHQHGTVKLIDKTTAAYYTWTLPTGTVRLASGDSSQLQIIGPGTYIVAASPAEGCPATKIDTIVVPIDTFPPVATAGVGLVGSELQLYGGDTAKSDYMTPFGGSKGLNWSWSGPNSFTSTIQDPLTDTVWGTYLLKVTEKRNGCSATASIPITDAMFTVLMTSSVRLSGAVNGQHIDLHWEDENAARDQTFIVERSNGSADFSDIGKVSDCFAFIDQHPFENNNLYRLKIISTDGDMHYSSIITVDAARMPISNIYLAVTASENSTLVVNTATAWSGELILYSASGEAIQKQQVHVNQGVNSIPIAHPSSPMVGVITLYDNGGKLVWCGKTFF
jgi:hypothetical protein